MAGVSLSRRFFCGLGPGLSAWRTPGPAPLHAEPTSWAGPPFLDQGRMSRPAPPPLCVPGVGAGAELSVSGDAFGFSLQKPSDYQWIVTSSSSRITHCPRGPLLLIPVMPQFHFCGTGAASIQGGARRGSATLSSQASCGLCPHLEPPLRTLRGGVGERRLRVCGLRAALCLAHSPGSSLRCPSPRSLWGKGQGSGFLLPWGTGLGTQQSRGEVLAGPYPPLPFLCDWAAAFASQVKLETELCLQLGK